MQKLLWITSSVAVVACLIVAAVWSYRTFTQGAGGGKRAAVALAGEGLYVNERVCGECHPERASGHQQSGHANTFRISAHSLMAAQLVGQVFEDPERGYSYEYHLDDQARLSASIPQQFGEDRFPLMYALGSGHNAVTFLTLIPDRWGDTVGIEHRLSLYRGQAGWELDLTPGHEQASVGQDVEHFGKVIRGDKLSRCIGCHTTTADISGQQLTELRPNVGCQSCHGPGREHVIAVEAGEEGGYSGVTAQTVAQEIQLCGRCHRLPSDESDAETSANNIQNVRFQPVGLLQSRCFTESNRLKCSSCHDPHQRVSRDRDHYVTRCLNCHGDSKSTMCPISPRKNCIPCHMPAVEVHRGIKFHDHWIRVRADERDRVPERSAQGNRQ